MTLPIIDAFLIPLLASEVGIPMAGVQLLTALDAPPAFAPTIAGQIAAYRVHGPAVGQQIVEIEEMLARNRLPVPPRPDSYDDYLRWCDATVKAVAGATGPTDPAGAVAALARSLGELVQTLALHIVVVTLRQGAPDLAALRDEDERLTRRYAEQLTRLEKMAQFPTLPEAARPHAEQLAAMARLAPTLDAKTSGAAHLSGLKLVYGRLGAATGELRAALGG
jgi:hypothetical protein